MSGVSQDAIMERLSALEESNRSMSRVIRWMRLSFLVVFAAVIFLASLPFSKQFWSNVAVSRNQVLYASGFVVVGENGKQRVNIGASDSGGNICINDSDGRPRASLGTLGSDKNNSSLSSSSSVNLMLWDEQFHSRLSLSADSNRSGLTLSDDKHLVGVSLSLSQDGSELTFNDAISDKGLSLSQNESGLAGSRLMFMDGGSKPRIMLSLLNVPPTESLTEEFKKALGGRLCGLSILDENGKPVAEVPPRSSRGTGQAEAPSDAGDKEASKRTMKAGSFILVDSDGKERAALSMVEGEPGLTFWSPLGKPRAILGSAGDGGVLSLFGSNGEPQSTLTGFVPAEASRYLAAGGVLAIHGADSDQGMCITRNALIMGTPQINQLVLLNDHSGPLFSLNNQKGQPRATLAYQHAESKSSLVLRGARKGCIAITEGADDAPSIGLLDENGVTRVGIGACSMRNAKTNIDYVTEPSNMVLFGKDGSCEVKLPEQLSHDAAIRRILDSK